AAIARERLWEPVRALAFRALADHGWRSELAGCLPAEGPLSLAEADAWLDAAHSGSGPGLLTERIVADDSPLPQAARDRGAALIEVEAALACRGPSGSIEEALAALVGREEDAFP